LKFIIDHQMNYTS